jgi:hypothetical protein
MTDQVCGGCGTGSLSPMAGAALAVVARRAMEMVDASAVKETILQVLINL